MLKYNHIVDSFPPPPPYESPAHLLILIWIFVSVNTLRVAKPEKGQKIEAMLIQMAQTGQLGGRIGEDELKGLLGKVRILCMFIKSSW